jgi:hypothetical protein
MAEARGEKRYDAVVDSVASRQECSSRLATSKYELYWLRRTYRGTVSTFAEVCPFILFETLRPHAFILGFWNRTEQRGQVGDIPVLYAEGLGFQS